LGVFYIKWQYLSEEFNSWEPGNHLDNLSTILIFLQTNKIDLSSTTSQTSTGVLPYVFPPTIAIINRDSIASPYAIINRDSKLSSHVQPVETDHHPVISNMPENIFSGILPGFTSEVRESVYLCAKSDGSEISERQRLSLIRKDPFPSPMDYLDNESHETLDKISEEATQSILYNPKINNIILPCLPDDSSSDDFSLNIEEPSSSIISSSDSKSFTTSSDTLNSMSAFRSFRKLSSRSFSFRKPALSRSNTEQTLQRPRSKSDQPSPKNTIIRKPSLHRTLTNQTLQSRSKSKSDYPTNPSSSAQPDLGSSTALKVKDLNIQVKESIQTSSKPLKRQPSRAKSIRRALSLQKS